MAKTRWHWTGAVVLNSLLGVPFVVWWSGRAVAQEFAPPVPVALPTASPGDRPLPITLPTALQLAGVRPLDVALASQRTELAAAELQKAQLQWLPTITVGGDYYRHDGEIQDVAGLPLGTSKSSLMLGLGSGIGSNAVLSISDAIFAPLSARQVLSAREASLQAVRNDTMTAVAEAYFNVQQARGELAGALEVVRRAEELVRRAEQLAPGLVPPVEAVRARTELARRRLAIHQLQERWRVASAELAQVLRLDSGALVEPVEPPHLQVILIDPHRPVDDLVPVALCNRPELAAQQAVVQSTLQRLRAERLRPLMPSILIRGASTNPAGTLATGLFGSGKNDTLRDFNARSDVDVQLLWEFKNLGFGNHARVREQKAENQLASLELFRLQDKIAAEVVSEHAHAIAAAERLAVAAAEVKDASDSLQKNFEGLGQTRRAGELLGLVIRPAEVVAAVQALSQAFTDYYGAVGDANRAQFRLYRALGHPAQDVLCQIPAWPVPAGTGVPAPPPSPSKPDVPPTPGPGPASPVSSTVPETRSPAERPPGRPAAPAGPRQKP